MGKKKIFRWNLVRKIGNLTIKTPYETKVAVDRAFKFLERQKVGKLTIEPIKKKIKKVAKKAPKKRRR